MMPMKRYDRMTGILLLLQERGRTAEELARHFEVSRRTVLRDIQALCEIGVPIVAREGVGGGYSLPEDYWLAPLPLTTGEVFLLLLALRALARLGAAPFAQEGASLESKLRSILPAPRVADAEALMDSVAVGGPERRPAAPFLDELLAAARAGRWLRVEYQSTDGHSVRHLLPRQIYAEHGLWYCRAYTHERGEERTYRVDRIRALAPAERDFRPGATTESLPYHDTSHPEVVVLLTARGARAVESDPHLGPQPQLAPDGSARLVFRCPPHELDWFARYFAGLGDAADVRAPAELRRRLLDLGQHLCERYREW
jgi:predicted DNA-binding transcriptional regulator YafY